MLLIVFTGYLIIYNIFRISVSGDIRFYGLLKTIGTTGKQIRRMLRRQALVLSALGIPIGLLAGWLAGAVLTPIIMSNMSYKTTTMSADPRIFAGAALFAFVTVLLSCRKPAAIAGRVSPVEAVRYTESSAGRRTSKKGQNGVKISRMAWTNLGRSKWKTGLVILSLSLAVVLLNVTYTFATGFDMDKYLQKNVCTDFIFGHADYFQSGFSSADQGVEETMIDRICSRGAVTEGGRIYGRVSAMLQYVTEEQYRDTYGKYYQSDPEALEAIIASENHDENGLVSDRVELYGMEDFPLSRLNVLEGDLSKLKEDGDYIAAVVEIDDYDEPIEETQHRQVGDTVKIEYIQDFMYVDGCTGEPASEATPEEYMEMKVLESHIKEYTVCARVTMRPTMGYRYYGAEAFVLPAGAFREDTGTDTVMTYVFDVKDGTDEAMESFLADYTENEESMYDYESKAYYVGEFEGLRSMFLLMGGVLSGVIGIIGILNFINAVVTSVISRKRELAVLQAVGMTGRQLVKMLMLEGCMYGICAILAALILNLVFSPLLSNVLSGMFWFYTYRFTVLPILLVTPVFLLFGILIPLAAYRYLGRQSVVERIREAE